MSTKSDVLWQDPPDLPDSPAGVDVWRCPLDRDEAEAIDCARLLSAEERARAARLVFDHDRRRWTVARGLLRRVLGRYLRRPPEELTFETNAWGKPSLRDHPSLSFNLSHSGPLMLIAVAGGRRVGIDLEQIRTDIDLTGVPELYLSSQERASLAALPADHLPAAFFDVWTRKESVVKALGRGLTVPLDVESASGLELRTLPVGPSFAATVAGAVDPLRFWRC